MRSQEFSTVLKIYLLLKTKLQKNSNICNIKSAKRRLEKLGESSHLDRLRMMKLASKVLLRVNVVKLNETLVEERVKNRQVYSIRHPQATEEEIDQLEDREHPDLTLSQYDFSRLWWNFIDVRQQVAASVSSNRRQYGQLLDGAFGGGKQKEERFERKGNGNNKGNGNGNGGAKPKVRVNAQQHQNKKDYKNDREEGKDVYIKFEGKCSIRSCQGEHWTRNCLENIKTSKIPADIVKRILESDSCIRCLSPNEKCKSNCQGGYLGFDRETNKRKFRSTDCNKGCIYTVKGKRTPINYLICKCRRENQEKWKEEEKGGDKGDKRGSCQKPQNRKGEKQKAKGGRREAKMNNVKFEENSSEDEESEQDGSSDEEHHINNFVVLANDHKIETGYASQMIEQIPLFNSRTGRYHPTLVLWDSGTNATSVDMDFAEEYFLEREETEPVSVRSIHGKGTANTKYVLQTKDKKGNTYEFSSMGLKNMANNYEESEIIAPKLLPPPSTGKLPTVVSSSPICSACIPCCSSP